MTVSKNRQMDVISVCIPKVILKEIDKQADSYQIKRSEFIRHILIKHFKKSGGESGEPSVRE